MNTPIINPNSATLLDAYRAHPVSGLILQGGEYSGVRSIVEQLASDLLPGDATNNIVIVEGDPGKSITIEQIRDLKKSITTIATSSEAIGRVVIIHNAHTMTQEAQNALLKLIEEPASKTAVILHSNSINKLLGTIRSRCHTISILPITQNQAHKYADSHGYDKKQADKALLLSKGESDLFVSLLEGDSQLLPDIQRAKDFLALSIFERLALQKKYTKPETLLPLISGMLRISEAAMRSSQPASMSRWKRIVEQTHECEQLLEGRVNTKLVFLRLCTHT